MSDPTPQIVNRTPFAVELEAGKSYWWCACGMSRNQPFCDGSHKDSPFEPVKFTADTAGKAWLCGCKQTGNRPFCDGTHQKL